MSKQAVCNRDCFNCVYEDCVLDDLSLEDYKQTTTIEKELLFPKSQKQKKIAAGQKAYYEANREKIRNYMRDYMRKKRGPEVRAL